MPKEMFSVQVYISDVGNVVVSQENLYDEADKIIPHPDQVPTIIKWLQAAHEEALGYEGPRIVGET